jgi:hypothetical protein
LQISLRKTAANAAKRSDAKHSSAGSSNQRTKKFSEVAADVANGPQIGSIVTTGESTSVECGVVANAYLRAAQAYMLISMPTGTSMIFGVFQVISDLLSTGRQVADRNKDRTDPKIAQADILLAQFRECRFRWAQRDLRCKTSNSISDSPRPGSVGANRQIQPNPVQPRQKPKSPR